MMLTAAKLAAELDTSTRQVERWVKAGMPYQPIGPRGKRYDAAVCRIWLMERYPPCQSNSRPAPGTSTSRSTANAYTAALTRAQVRALPSSTSSNCEPRSAAAERLLSLVTPR